jgi:hypothetical protein
MSRRPASVVKKTINRALSQHDAVTAPVGRVRVVGEQR